jgi:hypothetical protein
MPATPASRGHTLGLPPTSRRLRVSATAVSTGISFIFEDTFDVGEKVEILNVEGVIEAVNLRTSTLRAPTGELYIVPNGEIRLIRNFSRGRFSITKITLKLAGEDLGHARNWWRSQQQPMILQFTAVAIVGVDALVSL